VDRQIDETALHRLWNRRTAHRQTACARVLVHHIVEVVRRGQRLELGTEGFQLYGVGGQALDKFLHRAHRTLHEQPEVRDAERTRIS
jgi:hypothetical protein